MKRIIFSISLILLLSCGKKEEISHQYPLSNNLNISEDGNYKGFFLPINSAVVGLASGNVKIKLINDQFQVQIGMIGTPHDEHSQYLYEGERCPSTEDDLNQDGYIDAKEGEEVYGMALIPFDSSISQQFEEKIEFPISNRLGSYTYEQSTQWSKILQDLSLNDPNLKDHISKTNHGINLDGKVIVIHGVDNSVYLPSTIEGHENIEVRKSLPIACAKINLTTIVE